MLSSRSRVLALAIGAVVLVAVGIVVFDFVRKSSAPEFTAGPPRVRLISQAQYASVVRDLFGSDIAVPARFPVVRQEFGLRALGSMTAEVTPGGFEQFYDAAREVSSQVLDASRRMTTVPCTPADTREPNPKCAEAFVKGVGRILYRRQLAADEITQLVGLATEGAKASRDFYDGLGNSLTALLVSPKFLLIGDTVRPDVKGSSVELDAHSKATRLSLFLWNSFPDDELLTAVEQGDLDTERGYLRQVERMFASPRLESGVRTFFDDMLAWQDLDVLSKDSSRYPFFSKEAAAAFKEQTLRTIVDHTVAQDRDYRDLFTTTRTFINGSLSPLYEMPVPSGTDWAAVEADAEQRVGILSQPSFLALYAHPARSSATRRGRGLREVFLCQKVPDPPPDVDFSLLEDAGHKFATARERVDFHLQNAACAGCHKVTDPIGLALENFDGEGRYRATEGGHPIDGSGTLDGRKFTNLMELGQAVRDAPALTTCLTNKLAAYGFGLELRGPNAPMLRHLVTEFAEDGYRLKPLMKDIASNPMFYTVSLDAKASPGAQVAMSDH
jgi:hypothetical protein